MTYIKVSPWEIFICFQMYWNLNFGDFKMYLSMIIATYCRQLEHHTCLLHIFAVKETCSKLRSSQSAGHLAHGNQGGGANIKILIVIIDVPILFFFIFSPHGSRFSLKKFSICFVPHPSLRWSSLKSTKSWKSVRRSPGNGVSNGKSAADVVGRQDLQRSRNLGQLRLQTHRDGKFRECLRSSEESYGHAE